jgi:hypothetical protein
MERLRMLDDRRSDVAYHIAWVLDAEGRDDEAAHWYQRALKANAAQEVEVRLSSDQHLGALVGLAMVLVRAGRPDDATDVLAAAAARFPRSEQVGALQLLVQGKRGTWESPVDSGR